MASYTQQQQLMRLSPEAVRRRASSIVGCRELPTTSNNQHVNGSSEHSNHTSTVCTFLVGCNPYSHPNVLSSSIHKTNHLARVTVYCDTGTIATARILDGQVRHVFQRAVASLDVVERCLRQPAALPAIDWKLIGFGDRDYRLEAERPVADDVAKNLELAGVGTAILRGERDKLARHLESLREREERPGRTVAAAAAAVPSPWSASLEGRLPPPSVDNASYHQPQSRRTSSPLRSQQQQQQQLSSDPQPSTDGSNPTNTTTNQTTTTPTTTTTTATNHALAARRSHSTNSSTRSNDDSSTTGMEFQFSLAAGPMKHVDQCLSDIRRMNKLVRGVATNGVGTVFLYGNGGVAYTPNIPRALYHRLSQLRHSRVHSSRPAYVALGTRERYFVAFHDGTFSHKGPKALDRELRKLSVPPAAVAFGGHYETFLLVFADGTWHCGHQGSGGGGGRGGLPADLEAQLARFRAARVRLAGVTLGPAGEWFLRSRDGRVGWGGVSAELDGAIRELLAADHFINFLDFGESGSYFVSYD